MLSKTNLESAVKTVLEVATAKREAIKKLTKEKKDVTKLKEELATLNSVKFILGREVKAIGKCDCKKKEKKTAK